jgi:hypothetical protein
MTRLKEILKWIEMDTNLGNTKIMIISWQPLPVQIMTDQKQPQTVEYFTI